MYETSWRNRGQHLRQVVVSIQNVELWQRVGRFAASPVCVEEHDIGVGRLLSTQA